MFTESASSSQSSERGDEAQHDTGQHDDGGEEQDPAGRERCRRARLWMLLVGGRTPGALRGDLHGGQRYTDPAVIRAERCDHRRS